jgi:hypothetical protein
MCMTFLKNDSPGECVPHTPYYTVWAAIIFSPLHRTLQLTHDMRDRFLGAGRLGLALVGFALRDSDQHLEP